MLRRFSISVRLFGLVGLVVLFSAALFLCVAVIAVPLQERVVRNTQQIMLEGEKGKIKAAAHSMAVVLEQAMRSGRTDAERNDLIRKLIDPVRYEDDASGYYFVYRGTVNIALPPIPELVGQDLNAFVDANGVSYIQELLRRAHEGGGFVRYTFPKPFAREEQKLSYAEMIPGTDYWIGTGVYIDNVQREEARIADMIRSHFHNAATVAAVLFLLMVAVLCALCLVIGYSVARPLAEATRAAECIAGGDFDIALDAVGNDEASRLQAALNRMTTVLRQNIQEIRLRRAEAEEKAALLQEALQEASRAGREVLAQMALRFESLQKISEAVAHQLRNPTTIIGGLAGLLRKTPVLKPNALEYLDGIIDAAKRIEHIVQEVQIYNAIHLSRLETVQARDVLEEGRLAGEETARRLGLRVGWEIEDAEVSILADKALLAMAVREVAINAVESLPAAGGKVRLAASRDAEGVAIVVADSGKGIAEEKFQFLMDPFYTTKSIGVGMGLTKAQRVLQEHGGSIAIRSEPGAGTTVTLFLPAMVGTKAAF